MILGVLFGFLARFLFPGTITDGLCTYVLGPVKTIFMNSLKIIIGPIVFFSIVTCFSQFKSIEELGRIGIKVMGMYLLTTIFAIILGIGSFAIFQPGSWGFVLRGKLATTAVSLDVSDVDISLLNTIINIVPSNFVQPFVASDTLQLIFLAVICGVSLGKIKDYSEVLQELFEALYSLFMTMTNIFIKVMPLAIFASMAIMIVDIGAQSLIYILQVMGLFILAIVAMLLYMECLSCCWASLTRSPSLGMSGKACLQVSSSVRAQLPCLLHCGLAPTNWEFPRKSVISQSLLVQQSTWTATAYSTRSWVSSWHVPTEWRCRCRRCSHFLLPSCSCLSQHPVFRVPESSCWPRC